jgi:hypothetical protein
VLQELLEILVQLVRSVIQVRKALQALLVPVKLVRQEILARLVILARLARLVILAQLVQVKLEQQAQLV